MKKKYKKEKRVLFSTDGQGKWYKREWADQCDCDVFFYGRCQGVKGHKGIHWCYEPCGTLAWDDNKDDPKKGAERGCAGSIPPGHKRYIQPEKMIKKLWLEHYKDTKVTDAKEIARLERDETKEGECVTRPCTLDDEEDLRKALKKGKRKK